MPSPIKLKLNLVALLDQAPKHLLAARVESQLNDPRLGNLTGKIDKQQLITLAHKPEALFLYDTKTNNINVVQKIGDVLLRITSLNDEFKIISVGVVRDRNVVNSIRNGRFVPIGNQSPNLLLLKNNIGVNP